jgi:hypothetical protein
MVAKQNILLGARRVFELSVIPVVLLCLFLFPTADVDSHRAPSGLKLGPILLEHTSMVSPNSSDCPTGFSCGAHAPYCQNYLPPRLQGAKPIRSLPYKITEPGNYYLVQDLASPSVGIAVLTSRGKVDINLNGHTITYGANRELKRAFGAYGVLICTGGGNNAFELNPWYESNGYCQRTGIPSSSDVTIENGTITQSSDAPGVAVPNAECPGAGVHCAKDFPDTFSHVINAMANANLVVRHVTLNWQKVGSDGIRQNWPRGGDVFECNTLNNRVTEIDARSKLEGTAIWVGNSRGKPAGFKIRYNSVFGGPQMGIFNSVPDSSIEYNDINLGLFQPGGMYTNDYAIGGGSPGGTIAFNYIHNTSGRGIGAGDAANPGLQIHDNYVETIERALNAEYGVNGGFNGCEIDGTYGIWIRSTFGVDIYRNKIIVHSDECGAQGIKLTSIPCARDIACRNPSPIRIHENSIFALASTHRNTRQPLRCYSFSSVDGEAAGYFAEPFQNDTCTSDGSFSGTDWDMGRGVHFSHETFISQNTGVSNSDEPVLMDWGGGATGPETPPDETGWEFADMVFNKRVKRLFKAGSKDLAHEGSLSWTYSLTVRSASGTSLSGVQVLVTDSGGRISHGVTDANGRAEIVLVESEVRNAPHEELRSIGHNPQKIILSRDGCPNLSYSLSVTNSLQDTRIMDCH